ncbi:MAG: DMT family transporter [Gammaproteobacteria bacterium]|nr:DMT family transporter [Gammaproteobacteria bacterium]MDH3450419.1 DMT family transporter [Gammaproteobacteria bacterium]
MPSTTVTIKPLLLLASLSLFWGLNWPGMKIILSEMTVWWFRALCLLVGGAILMLVSALSGNRWLLRRQEFLPVMTCGSFAILGWMVFSAYGVSLMPAGRASIIAFTMPLWATVIAASVLDEKVTRAKIGGLLLGLLGLGVLIGPDLLILQRAPVGAFFMLLAALSWALGTVLIKRTSWRIPTLSNVAWQLLLSSIPVTLVAMLSEPLPDLSVLSTPAMIALAYLFVFPMSFCQWAYFKTVGLLPASIAAIGTLMVPVIGVFSSHLILDESVGINELLALLLVLSALVLVLLIPAWQGAQRARELKPENLAGG